MIGTILTVDDDRLGGELTIDAAETDTVIYVDDTDDFEEAGGFLLADDYSYAYTAVDDGTGAITIPDGLQEDLIAPVWVAPCDESGNEAIIRVATVDLGDGDAVQAVMTSEKGAFSGPGLRSARGGEKVRLAEDGSGGLRVSHVLGRSPQLETTVTQRVVSSPPMSPGAAVFQYDDCWYKQKALLDFHAALGQRVSIAATWMDGTNTFGYNVGHPTCLDIDDLKAAQDQGHEILNHTYRHIDMGAATAATRRTSLDDLNNDLTSNGIKLPTFFAYPFGARTPPSDRDLACQFKAFRYAGTGVTAETPAGRFRIGATQILRNSATLSNPSTSLKVDDVKALVRELLVKPYVLSFFWHGGPSYTTEATIAEMKSIARLCHTLGIRVITVSEAIEGMNLVPNPSFEDGLNAWPISGSSGGGSDAAASITPYVGGEGSFAWHGHLNAGGDYVYRGARVPVKAGESYWLSGRYQLAGPGAPTSRAADAFGRTSASGWGNADTGGTYTKVGGVNGDYTVGSGVGTITAADAIARDQVLLTPSRADGEIVVRFRCNGVSGSGNNDARVLFRHLGGANNDHVRVNLSNPATGGLYFQVVKRVGGVETTLITQLIKIGTISGQTPIGFAANTWYWARIRFRGTTVWARAWQDGTEEQDGTWQLIYTDAALPVAAGGLGLGKKNGAASSFVHDFDDWSVVDTDPQDATGLRLKLWWVDANGDNPDVSSDTRDYNLGTSSTWKRIGYDAVLTAPDYAVFAEYRIDFRSIAGADAYVDHVVLGLSRLQPDGSLG